MTFQLLGCLIPGQGAACDAREVADRVVFMDAGVVVESGKPADVLSNPQHERTKAFLSKVL